MGSLKRFGALALDVNGRSLWTLADNRMYEIDVAGGRIVAGPFDSPATLRALAMVDEPRAALAPAVPALSPAALAVLPSLSA